MLFGFLIVTGRIARLILDAFSELIFSLLYSSSHTPLPPITSPLILDSASVLAHKIRTGKVTSREVVEVFINRIEEVNPSINCAVDTCYSLARTEADRVDQVIAKADSSQLDQLARDKPFLGVPFSCKDCIAAKGLSWTAGLYYRRHVKAPEDATSVTRMRAAGGIFLTVTNVSELCMWMESSNTVYGRSNNPYHNGRIVGGSSGGEGGLIAAAGTPFGIGSDVGGSIRMPAFFNGIFGHKATTGMVENRGQLPVAHGNHDKYLGTGPMCRHAEDLLPMLKVLAGPANSELLQLDMPVDVKKLKFYYMEDDGGFPLISPVHPELKGAQRRFIARFQTEFSIVPVKLDLPQLFYSSIIWSSAMGSVPESPSFAVELLDNQPDGRKLNPFSELVWWALGRSVHTLPAILLCLLEKFVSKESRHVHKYMKMGAELRDELNHRLGQDGVFIYPSHSTPAPYHGQPIVKPYNFSYTAIFNILGLPVTQVPLGLGSWGVPLGLQVVGGLNADRNTLAVAREAERMFGGWVPPSVVA